MNKLLLAVALAASCVGCLNENAKTVKENTAPESVDAIPEDSATEETVINTADRNKQSKSSEKSSEKSSAELSSGTSGAKSKNIFKSYQDSAIQKQVRLELTQIESALKAFYLNTGKRPTDISDLVRCPETMTTKEWRGPYLADEKILKDPWANPYKLVVADKEISTNRFTISSSGPNGIAGDGDDITNKLQ